MRIFIFLCFLFGLSWTAFAQTPLDDLPIPGTPRQKIVDEIIENPEPNLLIELRGVSEIDVEIEQELEALTPLPEKPETEQAGVETEEIEKHDEEPRALAPFYLSAEEYLELRGPEKQKHMILDYEVITGGLGEETAARTEDIRLIIGRDFASIQGPKSQKIYDFKMNRVLEIKPAKTLENETETTLFFDNISLYAKAYRNISTVRQATQNGKFRRIQISKDQEIDSFWLESSMSWAAAELESPLKIKSTKSSMLAIWDGESVVSSSFAGDAYEDKAFKNSLLAFAHHVWPIHPKILVEFYNFDRPPQSLEMVSFGPAQPKGQKQKWTLKNQTIDKAIFPLPLNALSSVERRPVSPLVFVISEAVENRAMGGIATPEMIEAAFFKAGKAGDKLSQWLEGQRYNAYSGQCEMAVKNSVCDSLSELTEANKFSAIGTLDPKGKTLSDFISATEMAKFKKSRGTALFTLQPYLDDADTPAIVLRSAAMARASMKKAEAEKSGVGAIQAGALLKQALAKDPYDPHTYVGLAQVYAAKGAFEQSWDIYDVLRAAIPTVDAVSLRIDQAETKLLSTGPGYFLPNEARF
jgi:hypothetical protein